ncbi:MAG TPA: CDP-alcohol phosphatidyltransferase family protein [archaeon]|nr:CDP-alcohol phosphatidyltransferase family protein [archaeon]
MLYKNRDKFKAKNDKVGKFFSKMPLTANQWTFLSIIFALISSFYIITGNFLTAAVLFAIASVMDVVDGAVARARNSASPKGGHLDNIVDRYVEFIIIFGLMFVSLPLYYIDSKVWLLLLLFGSMMTTYSKASAAEQMKISVKGGILERGERLILLFVALVAGTFSKDIMSGIIIIAAILANVTALQRIAMSFIVNQRNNQVL